MARRRAGAFAPIWVAPQKFSGFCPKDQIQFWSFRGQGPFFLAWKGPGRKELTPWQTKTFPTRSTCPRTKCRAHGTIKTDEAGTLDFSGVPAFLVTNAFIVQRSAAKMFNIVSGPQLLSIHQGFCDYRPGFQCPWTHDP